MICPIIYFGKFEYKILLRSFKPTYNGINPVDIYDLFTWCYVMFVIIS